MQKKDVKKKKPFQSDSQKKKIFFYKEAFFIQYSFIHLLLLCPHSNYCYSSCSYYYQ